MSSVSTPQSCSQTEVSRLANSGVILNVTGPQLHREAVGGISSVNTPQSCSQTEESSVANPGVFLNVENGSGTTGNTQQRNLDVSICSGLPLLKVMVHVFPWTNRMRAECLYIPVSYCTQPGT